MFPSTPSEFVTVVVHFHRAEIACMAGWRDRIDRTTNWAITVVVAMLSLCLSTPTAHHGALLFAMVLVALLLVIEARRYRFFDRRQLGATRSSHTRAEDCALLPMDPRISANGRLPDI